MEIIYDSTQRLQHIPINHKSILYFIVEKNLIFKHFAVHISVPIESGKILKFKKKYFRLFLWPVLSDPFLFQPNLIFPPVLWDPFLLQPGLILWPVLCAPFYFNQVWSFSP